MSVVATVLHVAHSAAIQFSGFAWAETDAEFNTDKVSPGPEGFIATAAFALAVIVLGFLLVRRVRRSQYRSEIREGIAEELAAEKPAAEEPVAGEHREPGAGDTPAKPDDA